MGYTLLTSGIFSNREGQSFFYFLSIAEVLFFSMFKLVDNIERVKIPNNIDIINVKLSKIRST